jgi:hypothetical protein
MLAVAAAVVVITLWSNSPGRSHGVGSSHRPGLRPSTGPSADPLRPALAAFTLAAGLHVVEAPRAWVLVALVPGVAALPLVLLPRLSALALLPLTADIAVAGAGVVLTAGRISRGAITAVDAAALSPLLALWLAPRIATRLHSAGRFGALLGAVIAGAIAVAVAWGFMRLRGR